MIIDLGKLANSAIEIDESYGPDAISLDSETASVAGKVRLTGRASNSDAVTILEGVISAELDLNCSRCLKAVREEIEFPFKAGFLSADDFTDEKEVQLELEDLAVSLHEEDILDVAEVVREQLVLSLPGHLLCKEDCKGLCDNCGADLNITDCKCKEDAVDPRWAALKNLKS